MSIFSDEVYKNEFGSCAFLAGAIEVLTGNLDVNVHNAGIQYESLAVDVFCIPTDDEINIRKLVCERLQLHIKEEGVPKSRENLIEVPSKMHIDFMTSPKTMKDTSFDLYHKSQWQIEREKLETAINNYCREVEFYLGKPKEVFKVTRDTIYNNEIMRYIYYSILYDIVFVRFEEHLLMFVRGSAE